MEDDLDEIASGTEEQVPWLERFYFGESARPERSQPAGRARPLARRRRRPRAEGRRARCISARSTPGRSTRSRSAPTPTGREIVVRVGRYGPYLQRGDDRAAVPEDLAPDELTLERSAELLENPSSDRVRRQRPGDRARPVLVRAGRFGPYVQLGEAGDGAEKPRTASLFKTMNVSDVTLEEALQLLELPRTVGGDPETGEEIVAANGRFGPFLKRGNETRSLDSEEQLFTVTLEEALARFAQPKQRRYGTSAAPLRELGADPDSGLAIVLRSGRFGPYVTDGTTNASLRRADDPDT